MHDRDSQGAGESGQSENAFLVRKTEQEMFALEEAAENATPTRCVDADCSPLKKISQTPPSL